MAHVVNPWEVSGDIDYAKLIKEFGLKPLENLPKEFDDNVLFRRKIIYAHRDFDVIVNAIKHKKPFVMMTGLMPSGPFHFGHKLVADQMIFYQKLGAKIYLTIADLEAYTSRNPDLKELHKIAVEEYLTNYVALGLDLDKCDFYFQSKRSVDGKKSNAYYALATELSRHATFNEFKAVYGEITPGKMSVSLLQASDMLHAQLPEFEGKPLPTVVPVGSDQDPHIRLCRDISGRIKLHKFMQISSTYHTFVPGLKGGKMSSSDPTTHIALSEDPKVVEKKIKKYAFSGGQATLEDHRRLGGNCEVDIAFQMMKYGLEPDDEKLKTIESEYRSGKLLSGEMKQLLIDRIIPFLIEHQKRREQAKKQVQDYLKKRSY